MYFTIGLYYENEIDQVSVKNSIRAYCISNNLRFISDFPTFFFIGNCGEEARREIYHLLTEFTVRNNNSIKFLISPLSRTNGYGGFLNDANNWSSINRLTGETFSNFFDLED